MGSFHSVRGWLELDEDQSSQVRAIIAADQDGLEHYASCWHFHPDAGYPQFAFFGCHVRASRLPQVRAQLERVAREVVSHDDEFTDYVVGVFHVALEDNGEIVWRLEGGTFTDHRTA